jgi:DNA-binding SARP family transcriptional activator/class 3 adenylate cyclase
VSEHNIEYLVLGPLEVRLAGTSIALGTGRERDLLGLLLVSADQVVSVDRLLDALWGEEPPAGAGHTLQVNVSKLRARLEPDRAKGAPPTRLLTRPPGYVLAIENEELDARRFEQLARNGRDELRAQRFDAAAGMLRDALACWRGPAYADVVYEAWAAPEAARLEELRLAVLEDRIEADLTLGRHVEVVAEVDALAREHTLRERLWSQLMLALYRAGRQADALRACDTLRGRLRDESGLDPSPAVRALEQAILAQDPTLDLVRPTEAAPRRHSPDPPLVASPTATSHRDATAAGDEQRIVTALFADVTGSTPLGEFLDAEEFKIVVEEFVSRMVTSVENYGGNVVSIAGDGILALFGAPVAHEDDAERALRAALDLVAATGEHGVAIGDAWQVDPPAVRVGVHTGLVALGSMGPNAEVEFTAMGDTINTAARLQVAARSGVVLVGESTRRLVEPLFEFGDIDAYTVKGKADPVRACELEGVRAARGALRGVAGAPVEMVDRAEELAVGVARIDDVLVGVGGVLFITGAAGLGKSRLLTELHGYFEGADAGTRPKRWFVGRSLSYGERISYGPYRELLRVWLGTAPGEPELRVRVRLRARLEALLGPRYADLLPFLGNVLGVSPDADALDLLRPLSPQALQAASFDAVATLFEALAEQGPVVVAIDDFHWADGDSVALTERLLPLTDAGAVLLIIVHRTERDHTSWAVRTRALGARPHRTSEIALTRLRDEHDMKLLRALLRDTVVPEPVRDQLLEKAEGNPFYIEEFVRSLIDTAVDRTVGVRDHAFVVPESVEKLIQSRIDLLPPASRQVLTAASVLGRQFDVDLLRGVVDGAPEIGAQLVELQRLEMFDEARRWPRPELRFRHSLIQETAYRTLVPSRRRELHARAARSLEARAATTSEESALLALHFDGAGDTERALHYHHLAAMDAVAVFANEVALSHFDAAIALLEETPPDDSSRHVEAELRFGRGRLLCHSGRLAPGEADLALALERARHTGERLLELDTVHEFGILLLVQGRSVEASSRFREALVLARDLGEHAHEVTLLGRIAIESVRELDFASALDCGEQALRVARDCGDDVAVVRALDSLKLVNLSIGRLDAFDTCSAELIERGRATNGLYYVQHALAERGIAEAARARWTDATECFEAALDLNEQTGYHIDRPLMFAVFADACRTHGEYGAATRHATTARDLVEAVGHRLWDSWSARTLSALAIDLLDFDAAWSWFARVSARGEDADAPPIAPDQLLRGLGAAAYASFRIGAFDRAQTELEMADRLLRVMRVPAGTTFLVGYEALVAVAQTHHGLGDPATAVAILDPLLSAARASGWFPAVALTALARASVHRAAGVDDAARLLVEEALELALSHELAGIEWRARAMRAGLTGKSVSAAEAGALVERLAASLDDPSHARAFVTRAAGEIDTLAR